MDFTAEAMEKTLEIARPELHEVLDVHGIVTQFATKPLHQVLAAPPELPKAVAVATLAGFADLVEAKLEGLDFPSDYLIHIQDEQTVTLKARESDEFGRRQVLIEARPVPFTRFKFGEWIDQEAFAINMASLFEDGGDKDYVIQMGAELTHDATSTSDDNGFIQKVNIRAGIRLKDSVTLKPRVDLAPYRTFPEVKQPISQFVFRAKCADNASPFLMLVEADGGRWKIDAIAKLRAAIEVFGLRIPIVA